MKTSPTLFHVQPQYGLSASQSAQYDGVATPIGSLTLSQSRQSIISKIDLHFASVQTKTSSFCT
jgi:hypothetical protein